MYFGQWKVIPLRSSALQEKNRPPCRPIENTDPRKLILKVHFRFVREISEHILNRHPGWCSSFSCYSPLYFRLPFLSLFLNCFCGPNCKGVSLFQVASDLCRQQKVSKSRWIQGKKQKPWPNWVSSYAMCNFTWKRKANLIISVYTSQKKLKRGMAEQCRKFAWFSRSFEVYIL